MKKNQQRLQTQHRVVNPLRNPQPPTLRSACFICLAWLKDPSPNVRRSTAKHKRLRTVRPYLLLGCWDRWRGILEMSIHPQNKIHLGNFCTWTKILDTKNHTTCINSFGKMRLKAHEINAYQCLMIRSNVLWCSATPGSVPFAVCLAGQIWHAVFLNGGQNQQMF